MSLERITTISPTTNQPVLTRSGISDEQLASLPVTAQEAFRSFSESTTLEQRQEIVARALGILDRKKGELARELTVQMGRPIAYTPVEITTAIKRGSYLNRISGDVLGKEEGRGVVPGDPEKGFKRFIKRKSVGVVLVIFAWNVSSLPSPFESFFQKRIFKF
jgi:acyl-CoA reductase-like NAD-dependent aldehyde dehydrogenase